MSLIDAEIVPLKPSLEYVVAQIKLKNKALYDNLLADHTGVFNYIWSNPDYTPKEIIGEFGADTLSLFTLSSKIQEVLAGANAEYQPLSPTKTVDIDPDTGVVTIGD